MDYVVIRSEYIADVREARRYYQERLAGRPHQVTCYGRPVVLFFDHGVNHAYTTDVSKGQPGAAVITRDLRGGRRETRVFCLDRARLMDQIIPAVCAYSFTLAGKAPVERHNRLVHGPRLPDGRYLRVVLASGPRGMWYCKSAYPLTAAEWLYARSSVAIKFPP
jgi:hypothetical protein